MDDQESNNGVIMAEDSAMADCEDEKVITMMDVLQEQQDFEDDANAVLGASDDKECTYSKGYIKRQAIYACLTCCGEAKTDPSKRAGVCLACSLNCHENHELVELYTKRNFRCDCGNPKFDSNPCQFTPNKPELNEDNSYNQNFSGVYCICSRPYPDPESTVDDEMIQCIICEDWLHASHLEAKVPPQDYAEMICKDCMAKNEFLHDYSSLAVNGLENEDVDVDDNIAKDSSMNGDTEVNGLNGSALNGVKSDVDEAKAEEKEEIGQSEEKSDNLETEPESSETEKSDQIATVSSVEDTSNREALSEEKLNQEDKEAEATPDHPTTEENVPSETVIGGSTDTNDKIESVELKPAEGNTEDKLQKPEQEENVDEKSVPITEENPKQQVDNVACTEKADNVELREQPSEEKVDNVELKEQPSEEKVDNVELGEQPSEEKVVNVETGGQLSEEKVDNVELGEQPSEEKEKGDTGISTETGSGEALPAENKDASGAAADDDNKEIDAIDELLAEGSTEEKSESEPATEKMETSAEIASVITNDTDNKPEAENEETKVEENTQVETGKEVIDSAADIEMNQVSTEENVPTTEPLTNGASDIKEHKRKFSTDDLEESQDTKKPKLVHSSCTRPKAGKKIFKGATFWPSHFRQKLCTCSECITMYKDLSVLFLTDLEDTVKAYEDLGKLRNNGAASTQYEKGLEALSSLDRIQQINALTEYNKMKDKLLDFLKSFKDRKEVVKEEDIKAFFAQMKPKREPDGVYFCR